MLINNASGEFGEEVVWMGLCIIQITSWLLRVNWKISNHFFLIFTSWGIWPAICYQSPIWKEHACILVLPENMNWEPLVGRWCETEENSSVTDQYSFNTKSIIAGSKENPRQISKIKHHWSQYSTYKLLSSTIMAATSYFVFLMFWIFDLF